MNLFVHRNVHLIQQTTPILFIVENIPTFTVVERIHSGPVDSRKTDWTKSNLLDLCNTDKDLHHFRNETVTVFSWSEKLRQGFLISPRKPGEFSSICKTWEWTILNIQAVLESQIVDIGSNYLLVEIDVSSGPVRVGWKVSGWIEVFPLFFNRYINGQVLKTSGPDYDFTMYLYNTKTIHIVRSRSLKDILVIFAFF